MPVLLENSGRGAGAAAGATAGVQRVTGPRSAGGAPLGCRASVLVLHPVVAAGARVAFVSPGATVLAADAGTDARLLELEVLDGVLDLVDELGHGLCGGGGGGGSGGWCCGGGFCSGG